jgi:heme oxygenase
MSLKELTKEQHTKAEGTMFMKAVFDRSLPMELWRDYTYQKELWYREIENAAKRAGLLDMLPGIERAALIRDDYQEMMKDRLGDYHIYREISKNYVIYIRSLTDTDDIMAHLYTWHMGDLFGGQMIKKIVNAPSTHLDFENAQDLMTNMRTMLTDDMASEANAAFEWAIMILETYDSDLEKS